MPRAARPSSVAPRLAVLGVAGYLLWRLLTPKAEREREFSLVAGRDYDVSLLAHPFGDFSEWWASAQEALETSGAHDVSFSSRSDADVVVHFVRTSPVTETLAAHAVLYPNTPSLATATLLEARPASGVTPLGTSTS